MAVCRDLVNGLQPASQLEEKCWEKVEEYSDEKMRDG